MFWQYVAISIAAGLVLFSLTLFLTIRWLAKRDPYRGFIRLRTRRKVTFFRLVLRDKRVPLYVKIIPVVLVIYLVTPVDIVPDFIPVLGHLDDLLIALLALFLVIKLTPPLVALDLIRQAQGSDSPPTVHL